MSDKRGVTTQRIEKKTDQYEIERPSPIEGLLDSDVKQYTLRIYGLPPTNPAIAIKAIWDYPFAHRAYIEAQLVLSFHGTRAEEELERSRLSKFLRKENNIVSIRRK